MGLDDRLLYIVLGAVIGFVFGYLTAAFRAANRKLDEIKEELDEVDEIVTGRKLPPKRDERGVISTRFGNIALAVIVALTAFSAFRSQVAVNNVNDNQNQQQSLATCTADFLAQTIKALNVRTTYTRNQATANVDLQRAQSEMLAILLHEPPYSQERQVSAFKAYFQALNGFVDAYGKSEDTADSNPYPTVLEFSRCIVYRTDHPEGE